jgi:phosphoribosylglycinamide formyltransferase 1
VSSPSRDPVRLAVLVSGSGTNLQALLDAIGADADFGGEVVVVGSDRPDAGGLDRARAAGIATAVQTLAAHPDRHTWEAALRAELETHRPRWWCSPGSCASSRAGSSPVGPTG